MDIRPHNPQGDLTSGRPNPAAPRPRPVMSDFAPTRRPAGPAPLAPRPAPIGGSVNAPAAMPKPTPQHHAPHPTHSAPQPPRPATPPQAPRPTAATAHREDDIPLPTKLDKTMGSAELKRRTGHAGLIGWGVFLVLTILFLSPFIPGKILDNFPGSSASSSTGDQTLACANDIQNASSTTAYDTKLGSPLVYKYSSTITLHGTCDGKTQTAVGGHISQFNPLALVINLSLAAVIAFAVAKIWAKIFGRKS